MKYEEIDEVELTTFRRRINTPAAAADVDTDYEWNRDYNKYMLRQYFPGRQGVANEFGFKSEDAVKEAVAHVIKLAPRAVEGE